VVNPRPERQFTAAIFDLGGVLIDWNPRHLYRKLFPGDEQGMEQFLAEVTTPAWNSQQDAGRPFVEAIAELQEAHPDQARLIAAYLERWPETIGGVTAATADIIRALKARSLRVYALSDWSAETFPKARSLVAELALFDDILISGEARMTKPNPEIFRLALQRFRLRAAESFFVDDVQANVDGAIAAGMTAFLFTDAPALRRTLEGIGVL
jgi:2-haloacid dehalogenase